MLTVYGKRMLVEASGLEAQLVHGQHEEEEGSVV